MTIGVIDYGAGNLASVLKALRFVGAEVRVVTAASQLDDVSGLVVPGVGHFRATAAIDRSIRDRIAANVAAGVPLLGICLGMQWLFADSDEAPDVPGLGIFPGRIRRLSGVEKIPHVGWNTIEQVGQNSPLLRSLPSMSSMYFTHGYAAPLGAETVATTSYGGTFASVVESGCVFGTQFHPEKSGSAGLQILSAFVRAARDARPSC